jgi:hypothetical protein
MTIKSFKSESFSRLANQNRLDFQVERALVEEIYVDSCVFDNCVILRDGPPSRRPVFRSIALRNCTLVNCAAYGPIFDEVSITGLKKEGRGPLFFWGAAFRHVILSGRIAGSLISNPDSASLCEPRINASEWNEANAKYYRDIDWALDISEARFTSIPALRNVPGRLIRRNAETQLLVTRERAHQVPWRNAGYGVYEIVIEKMMMYGMDSTVLVAAVAGRKVTEELGLLDRIRKSGLAESD